MNVRPAHFGRLGLRARTTTVFAAMIAVLSAAMALTVWLSVTRYLLDQRQEAATLQAGNHVEQVTGTLEQRSATPPESLARLPRSIGSVSFIRLESSDADDRWFASSLSLDREAIPGELLQLVTQGQPARQRVEVDGEAMLVVGFPLGEAADGAYFELFPMTDLQQTFQALSAFLLAGVVLVPAGTALLGGWAIRPALRPLDRVSAAARAVADGDLSARLDPRGDPTLASIADSFNRTAAALERRVRVDAQFAADVSHELRSPLTAVVGAVNVIGDHRSSLPEDAADMLDLLHAEVERLAQLVEDLLEISRMDAGSADLNLDEVRLAELVWHSVPGRGARLVHVTDQAEEAVVMVDKRRMERVLANLLDNAERHGGGVTAVNVYLEDGRAAVAVEDAGPGLDEGERERIFDRFARSRHSVRDSTRGAGLGLSLVARHLQLMGGTVHAENRAQGGARFVVTVPTSRTRGDGL